MMAKIVFATDFSPIAQHAATYAAHLAQYLKANLLLFHSYIIPFNYVDTGEPLLNAEEVREVAESSMTVEKIRLQNLKPQLSVSVKVLPGDLIECLQEEIKTESPDLIILGTSGDDADSVLWGSMAVKALRSFQLPVLTIPAKADWKDIYRIGFAADYNNISENTPFQEIQNWVSKMNAQLSVIHIDNPNGVSVPPPEILKNTFAENNPSYHSVSTENIVDGVQNFIQQNQIDWLVLIPRKYGFWGSLFHKSRTRMLAQVSHIPILALHQD